MVWRHFLYAISQTLLQDDYNKAIKKSNIAVMLYLTKVGKYTKKELETGPGKFQPANKALLYR